MDFTVTVGPVAHTLCDLCLLQSLDFSDLQKSLLLLSARHGGAASRSCCRRALSRYCCLRGRGVHATIALRSRMSDAWQCRTPAEHRPLHGNIYQRHDRHILY